MNEYTLVKLVHLGALIFWLGPALGAWFVFKAVEDSEYLAGSAGHKVSRVFFYTIVLEHIAFAVLLATGFYMALDYGWLGAEWLSQKLTIVMLVIVPLEVVDVVLGNWLANSATKKLYAGAVLKPWEQVGLRLYHGAFTKLALLIMPLAVIAVMYLAIGKLEFTLW
ncbi:hypothetical protein QWI17_15065 [Gilvimarinus sp. SDUM040013]|uniref:DUF2269 domain-containing protein n=1 Tax=Gilvimarinus gilvus TaxID=3058038 RepID=A0ABU4S1V5_9GAMM|nr:hypothetical protein [Gilvimarinus sp. SDUM040013]MDO3387166.1 hypothetical protein [Gilvimarinus sp. SDUM040013]MDX6850909.1 hypothetical protein [Gilvimarinus sp. SDUM040013]